MVHPLPEDPEPGDVVRAYVDALEEGDPEGILALFAEGATVESPLQGRKPAGAFYRDLARETRSSEVEVLRVVEDRRDGEAAALLRYDWTLADGAEAVFECVDLLDLDGDGRIRDLRVVYDASVAREAWEG